MQKRKHRAPKDAKAVDWSALTMKYAGLLVKLGGMGLVVCLSYFVYAIYGGALQSADPQRALSLVQAFGAGLIISSFALALGVVVLTAEELAYAVVVAIGGIALMLGVPYLVAGNLARNLMANLQPVAEELSTSGTNAGGAVLVVVGFRILYELFRQVVQAPDRRRAQAEKEAAEDAGILKKQKSIKPVTVFSKCWELPFCHERIREICPAYKARKSCWRYGIGCNCDPRLIESLIRMGAPGKGPQKSGDMKRRQDAYVRSDLAADVPLAAKADRTIPCSKCPIYNEHQRLKFKFVNPLAIIATVVLMGAAYAPVTQAWEAVAGGIVEVASTITLSQKNFDAGQWFTYLQGDVVQVSFFIIVSLLALSYVLKFTEWAVLEKKL